MHVKPVHTVGSTKRAASAIGLPAARQAPGRYRVDLGAHMGECDDNYERLVRLLPDLAVRDQWTLSMLLASTGATSGNAAGNAAGGSAAGATKAGGQGGLPVYLTVLERCPYTTTLRCSQPIGGSMAFIEPSLTVRMYHDARTAEVTEYQNEARFSAVYAYPNTRMRLPDEKVQINRLLGDLLMLCLPADDAGRGDLTPQ